MVDQFAYREPQRRQVRGQNIGLSGFTQHPWSRWSRHVTKVELTWCPMPDLRGRQRQAQARVWLWWRYLSRAG